MSYYEILLLAHILGVAVWLGGGVLLLILGTRLDKARDNVTLKGLFDQAGWLSMRVFTPVSLLVLVFGILLVIEGPWSFGQLWIVLGLIGFSATFVTGFFVLKPRAEAIAATLAREGMTEDAAAAMRRLFTLMRIDYTVITVVVVDMALKPRAEDVGTLALMAAVIVVVVVLVARSVRTSPAAPAVRDSA
jgi:uncharacterized membrane protein